VVNSLWPIPVGARSQALVCGRSPAANAGSNTAGARMSVSIDCCVLSGKGLCDGPITRPGDSYRVCV
jgi:hypothetical protein